MTEADRTKRQTERDFKDQRQDDPEIDFSEGEFIVESDGN